jgi:hypothetical protein
VFFTLKKSSSNSNIIKSIKEMAAEVENPPVAAEEKPVAEEAPAASEAVEPAKEEVKAEESKEVAPAKEAAPKKPSVFKQNFEKDVVYLYQFARTTSLPSLSPYVLKVETWLRLVGLKYEVSCCPQQFLTLSYNSNKHSLHTLIHVEFVSLPAYGDNWIKLTITIMMRKVRKKVKFFKVFSLDILIELSCKRDQMKTFTVII